MSDQAKHIQAEANSTFENFNESQTPGFRPIANDL